MNASPEIRIALDARDLARLLSSLHTLLRLARDEGMDSHPEYVQVAALAERIANAVGLAGVRATQRPADA